MVVSLVFVAICLIGTIAAIASADRVQRPFAPRAGDVCRVQHCFGVWVPAKVTRTWFNGPQEFAEVVADSTGERYLRPVELLERP